jgi:ParB family chromosome partitioning protein
MVEKRLGRGLDFFITSPGSAGDEITMLELSSLTPSPHQPRREFAAGELQELANSIRASGVLQPILVRKVAGRFEIVAGERRWRAAKMAGLERIPALVRDIADPTAAVVGLVENLQRADLNAMEKARAFQKIVQLTKASQEEVARQVGLDRSTVANFLRLLDLPPEVQELVSRGTITMGHARALLALATPEEIGVVATKIAKDRLSVRQVEELVQSLTTATKAATPASAPKGRPVWVSEIEETLTEALGVPVRVHYGRKRSRITLECGGRDQFERVYELLKSLAPEE